MDQECAGKIRELKLFCLCEHLFNQKAVGKNFGEILNNMGCRFVFEVHYFKSTPLSTNVKSVARNVVPLLSRIIYLNFQYILGAFASTSITYKHYAKVTTNSMISIRDIFSPIPLT